MISRWILIMGATRIAGLLPVRRRRREKSYAWLASSNKLPLLMSMSFGGLYTWRSSGMLFWATNTGKTPSEEVAGELPIILRELLCGDPMP